MSAFLSGVLFGALLIGAVFTVYLTRARPPHRDPIGWREDDFAPPPVVTKLTINKRTFDL